MMVDNTVNICVHEMCYNEKCGIKDESTYKEFFGLCDKKVSLDDSKKIRIPDRLDRKNFMERIEKILNPSHQLEKIH